MQDSALNYQESGDHYTKLKIQPLELGYLIHATPCFVKLSKYIVREKGTHLVDLKKGLTCIQIEEALTNRGIGLQYFEVVIDEDYVNKMIDEFTDILTYRMILKDMYFGEYEKAKNLLGALILEES